MFVHVTLNQARLSAILFWREAVAVRFVQEIDY
jgi:hypothetical protein